MLSHEDIVVYAARHGSTAMNEENKFRGNSNPPLDARGIMEANQLGHYLKDLDFSYLFTSTRQRTIQTAEIINQRRDSPIEIIQVEGFIPWDVGDFGGMPKDEETIKELQWYINNPDIPTPNGCSLNEFRSRVCPLLLEAGDLALNSEYPVLLVLHSSVIHEVGEVFGEHHEDAHVKPGGCSGVYIDPKTNHWAVEPIFKQDKRSTTQNALGISRNRSSLSS